MKGAGSKELPSVNEMFPSKAGLFLMVVCATKTAVMGGPAPFMSRGLPPYVSFAWSEVEDQGCNPPVKPGPSCMCWLYETPTGELQNYTQWFCNHEYPNGRPQIQGGQGQIPPIQRGQFAHSFQSSMQQVQATQQNQQIMQQARMDMQQ